MSGSPETAPGGRSSDEFEPDVEDSLWAAVRILLRQWKLIAAVVIGCWVLGGLYYYFATRIYESAALLAPAETESPQGMLGGLSSGLGGAARLAGIDLGTKDPEVDVALAMVVSRGFLEAFIAEENLAPRLYADRWDAKAGQWLPSEKPPTAQDAYLYFTRNVLRVARNRENGLVTLTVSWSDPGEAAQWARKIVARLNATMRARAEASARRNLEFLQSEVEKTAGVEIRQSIYRMMESQLNKVMLASVHEDYVFMIVDPPHVSDLNKQASPRLMIVALLSTFLGGLLGVGLVYGRLSARRAA